MKTLLITAALLFSLNANASQNITLTLSDELLSDNVKICVYSNSEYDFTYQVAKHSQCPYTKTFSTGD